MRRERAGRVFGGLAIAALALLVAAATPAWAISCNGAGRGISFPNRDSSNRIPGVSPPVLMRYEFGNGASVCTDDTSADLIVSTIAVRPSCVDPLLAPVLCQADIGADGVATSAPIAFVNLVGTTCPGGLDNITVDASDPFSVRLLFNTPLVLTAPSVCYVDLYVSVNDLGANGTPNQIAQAILTDGRCVCSNAQISASLAQTSTITLTSACPLDLEKTCAIVAPPATDWASCQGKIQRFTLLWPETAPGPISISGITNDAPGGQVLPGQKVTFTGPWSTNDLYLDISGAVSGRSTIHVSCSDKDMDGLTATNLEQQQVSPLGQDCGKVQGNGKALSGTWVNTWLLDGLVDADGKVLNCSPETVSTNMCYVEEQAPPSCGTGGSYKPGTLTFRYTGGGCSTQSNNQAAGKTYCSGQIDPSLPVTVAASAGASGPMTVAPGGTFTINRAAADTTFTLTNAGGTELDGIHTSCSQPLAVGDVYFSLTLVAMDGVGAGADVTYTYTVTNPPSSGVTVNNISVVDDKLGTIPGSPIASLAPGQSATLTATTRIDETTTNVARVYDDAGCARGDVTATATVTVLPPPPCTVSQTIYAVDDDKYRVRLTNNGNAVVTLDTMVLNWPAQATYGSIKEVRLDGSIFASSASVPPVPPGVTIGSDVAWTNPDVTKRQLDPGETRTLEIVFSAKWPKANCPNGTCFSGLATFAEGCQTDLGQ